MEEQQELLLDGIPEPDEPEEPDFKVGRDVARQRLRLWRQYEALETCSPQAVQSHRNAIAYMGGSLEYRNPLPNFIRHIMPNLKMPVRKA